MRPLVNGIFTIFLIAIFTPTVFAADEYPLRAKYPQLKVISTEELFNGFGDVIVVDVRSKFEFDVMRIIDAKHISVTNMAFIPELEKTRRRDDTKKLVFYCNGKTCEKSYEAAQTSEKSGFKNVSVYDAGIFDWVNAHPDKGAFFGQSPVDTSKILKKDDFNAKSLDFASFKAGAEGPNAVVIDVRDPVQRKKTPEIKNIKNIQLDKLTAVLEKKQFVDNDLYFLDAVGKQTVWLHYYLEKNGYKKYHFLAGGVDALK